MWHAVAAPTDEGRSNPCQHDAVPHTPGEEHDPDLAALQQGKRGEGGGGSGGQRRGIPTQVALAAQSPASRSCTSLPSRRQQPMQALPNQQQQKQQHRAAGRGRHATAAGLAGWQAGEGPLTMAAGGRFFWNLARTVPTLPWARVICSNRHIGAAAGHIAPSAQDDGGGRAASCHCLGGKRLAGARGWWRRRPGGFACWQASASSSCCAAQGFTLPACCLLPAGGATAARRSRRAWPEIATHTLRMHPTGRGCLLWDPAPRVACCNACLRCLRQLHCHCRPPAALRPRCLAALPLPANLAHPASSSQRSMGALQPTHPPSPTRNTHRTRVPCYPRSPPETSYTALPRPPQPAKQCKRTLPQMTRYMLPFFSVFAL